MQQHDLYQTFYDTSNLALAEDEHYKRREAYLKEISKKNEEEMNSLMGLENIYEKQTQKFQDLRTETKKLEEQVSITSLEEELSCDVLLINRLRRLIARFVTYKMEP